MNLTLSTKVKEAIKVSLAMVLVYGIALKVNWMNPSWAGLAVAMIALATAGQSIRKACSESLGGGWETREGKIAAELLPESVRQEMLQRTKYWKELLE